MAKSASKKKTGGTSNPDRRNGKAWARNHGQSVKPKKKTIERQMKDLEIKERRQARRLEGMARHAEEKRLAAEKAAAEAEMQLQIKLELEAQREAERQEKLRQDPIGMAKRIPKQRPKKLTLKERLYIAEEHF